MSETPPSSSAPVPGPWFGWRRLRVVGIAAFVASLPMSVNWTAPYVLLLLRLVLVGLAALFVFGLFERWPRRLPAWFPRWGLQVAAVAVVMPVAAALSYAFTTPHDVHWWTVKSRMEGFSFIAFVGLLVGPWVAMSALYRQISGQARSQALAFELERSQYERNALDARLRLLQAQVEPHFLFNTLANVRELVDEGSPQASSVLGSLIAYLRAAVPRLHDPGGTVAQELDLVRAYLDLMHMRIPDRLQYTIDVDPSSRLLRCPPMTLLTLVENAVRHGIDPSEEGGRIDVQVHVRDGRCRVEVADTGVGLAHSGEGLGTGLVNLRERMTLAFGGDARLQLLALQPHGACAQLDFPARTAT